MSGRAVVELAEYQPSWLQELVLMWRASFEAGVGVVDPHPLAAQEEYFLTQVLPQHAVSVALLEGQLVGFVAASTECVAQLYVRVGLQRQGIGSKLLNWAKARSGGNLSLFAFAQNRVACAFYEKHGFIETARGFEPTWRLEDVKYQWLSSGSEA